MESPEIAELAKLLRDNGDKVLNSQSKLTLSAPLLQTLNEAFSLIVERDVVNSTFQVVSTNNSKAQIYIDLQFLHDFIQKTLSLCVKKAIEDTEKYEVDVSKFRNLKRLEIHRISVLDIRGVQSLRAQLQCLICVRCLNNVKDILLDCGGDNSTGFVWSELKEAVFCYNNLESIDSSLEYLPWLQVLDLSHNKIVSAEALKWLPNLKFVNLSFNQLEMVPMFHNDSTRRLQILLISNNYIESLTGLQRLESVCELNLSNNCLLDHINLLPLSPLASLRWLSLYGNPLSYHTNHRKLTAKYLHSNTSTVKFLLDGHALSHAECQLTGSYKPLHRLNRGPRKHLSSESSNQSVATNSSEITGDIKLTDSIVTVIPQVKKKVREAVISERDASGEIISPVMSQSTLSTHSLDTPTEHLETKKQIETLVQQYGDTWLHSQGGSLVQNVLGIPQQIPSSIISSTSREELLFKTMLGTTPKAESPLLSSTPAENSNISEADQSNTSQQTKDLAFKSMLEGDTTYLSIQDSSASSETKKSSSEIFGPETLLDDYEASLSDQDNNDTANENHTYLVSVVNGSNTEEIFLLITDTKIKEGNVISARTRAQWNITTLLSCERTNATTVSLSFDTVKRDKQNRKYIMEQDDALKLEQHLREVLSARPLEEMNQLLFKCMKCSTHFSQEIEKSTVCQSPEDKKSTRNCPTCNSTLVVEMDDEIEEKHESTKEPVLSKVKKQAPEIPSKLVRSNSQSSIGRQSLGLGVTADLLPSMSHRSVGSLGESNSSHVSNANSTTSTADSATSVVGSIVRGDSDIEVISNPSQSSIEVLDRFSGIRKKSSEERRIAVVPSLETIEDNSINTVSYPLTAPGLTVVLTESSSSGSLTDSICTAIEQGSKQEKSDLQSSTTTSEECDSENQESKTVLSSSPSVLSSMLEGLFQSANNLISKTKSKSETVGDSKDIAPPIEYSYTDFSQVDHRLKLHLFQNLFEDDKELLIWLLRGVILNDCDAMTYPGCIILSTSKIYILNITGKEGEDPTKWLNKAFSYTVDRVQSIEVLPWKQGVVFSILQRGGTLGPSKFMCLLQDIMRTNNFLTYLASNSLNNEYTVNYNVSSVLTERLNSVCVPLSDDEESSPKVQLFTIFSSCAVVNENAKSLQVGAIIITTEDLIITDNKLSWLFSDLNATPAVFNRQVMSNLLEVSIFQNKILLNFLDDIANSEETWKIVMETQESVNNLISAINEPWEALFSVPLQVLTLTKDI